MKEFMKTVKRTFQVGHIDLLGYSAIALVSGVIGIIIMLVILEATGENDYLAMGGLMAIMISVLLLVFGGVFSFQQDFNIAISFGMTRKHYVPAKYLLNAANCFCCVAITLLIGLFEKFFYALLYPGARDLFGVDFLLEYPAVIVGFVFLIPMVVMLLGALFAKFGMKFFWVCWVLWMFTFTVLPKMITASHEEPDTLLGKMGIAIAQFFSGFNATQSIIFIVAVGITGMATSFLILRKQRVTQ